MLAKSPVVARALVAAVLLPGLTWIGTTGTASGAGMTGPVVTPTAAETTPSGNTSGFFQVRCAFSHTAADDPIVFPGQPGAAHSHEFFGNTTTDAFSTTESLRSQRHTCARPKDKSAYWVPSLTNNGRRVAPREMTAYYRSGKVRPGTVQPFPLGLRMIAGNGSATTPQPTDIVGWTCNVATPNVYPQPPASCDGRAVQLRIQFPNCWDGKNLDSPDHKSHMAYSWTDGDRTCPATHPVAVPALQTNFNWRIDGPLNGIALASHGIYSGHADFLNVWNPAAQQALVAECLHGALKCNSPAPMM